MISLSKRTRIHKSMKKNIRLLSPPINLTQSLNQNRQQILSPELVDQVIAGNRAAIRLLIENLTPVIQLAVVHILKRCTQSYQHNHIHLEVTDYCQEIFILIFKNNSKILRDWNPDKGMNLKSYISLITKRRVISSLRNIKFTQSLDDDTIDTNIDSFLKTPDEESQFINRHLLYRIIKSLKNEISSFGYEIFVQIFLYGYSAEEVASKMNLTKNSVYVWKNRLKAQAKNISVQLENDSTLSSLRNKQRETSKLRSIS